MIDRRRGSWAALLLPLAALFCAALAGLQIASDSGLAFCDQRMTMGAVGGHALLVCPIALGLILFAGLLGAVAAVVIWCDPEQRVQRALAARLRHRRPAPRSRTEQAAQPVLLRCAETPLAVGRGLRAPPALSVR